MLEVQECMFSVKGYISEFAVLKGEVRVKSWNLDKKIQLWSIFQMKIKIIVEHRLVRS